MSSKKSQYKKLVEEIEDWIYDTFFKTPLPGGRAIASELLRKGQCIVAGPVEEHLKAPIWSGGVGNFIKASEALGAVGCTGLEFHPEFFESVFFLQALDRYGNDLQEHIDSDRRALACMERRLDIVRTASGELCKGKSL